MSSLGYFKPAQTDAATFVNIIHVNDRLGIVAFSDNATVVYPQGGSAVVQMTSDSMIFQAAQTIMTLNTINMTNMSAAVTTAGNLLSAAPTPKGIVLLSDGMWNVGVNPLTVLPAGVPIYTIALGPGGAAAILSQIATQSGGTYHYAADPTQLQKVYDAIANQGQVAQLVVDEATQVRQFSAHSTTGTVAAGAPLADFLVSWGDWSVSYTPGTPTGQQVNVYLYDPNGQKVAVTPRAVGPGYVVLEVQDPLPGQYSLSAWYSGTGQLAYTAGILDANSSLNADLQVHAEEPGAGDPLEFSVHVDDEDEHATGARVLAHVESPLVSEDEALETHAAVLASWPAGEDAGSAEPRAKLAALVQQAGAGAILPRGHTPVQMTESRPGVYTGKLPAAAKPGAHTIRAEVTGIARSSGTPFQRTVQSSVLVSGETSR